MRALLLALLMVGGCERIVPRAQAAPERPAEPKKPGKKPPEQPVGFLRDAPAATMDEHRTSMDEFLHSALLLNYGQAEQAALRIARTAPLATSEFRVDPSEPHLPADFFAAQNDLRARAGDLARAAASKDRKAMTRAFGRVTEACMQCHSLFVDTTKQ